MNICSFVHQCNTYFLYSINRRHVSASHGRMCCIDGQKNKYSVLNECNRILKYNISHSYIVPHRNICIVTDVDTWACISDPTSHANLRKHPFDSNLPYIQTKYQGKVIRSQTPEVISSVRVCTYMKTELGAGVSTKSQQKTSRGDRVSESTRMLE
jgi:hypothetical protein